MGFFALQSDLDDYERRHCDKCIHGVRDACPVMIAHARHCHEENGRTSPGAAILDLLIPRDVHGNLPCRLWVARGSVRR